MKRILFLLLPTVLMLLAPGCSDDPVQVDSRPQYLVLGGDKAGGPYLELTDEILNALDYETVSGPLQYGEGGLLYTYMTTWPRGCLFSIQVPPYAEPVDHGYPTEFSLSVPTYQSYIDFQNETGQKLPLIVRLEPSGILWTQDIVVTATYMPWDLPAPPGSPLTLWVTSPDDPSILDTADTWWEKSLLRVQWSLPHFSDWDTRPVPPPAPPEP